MSARRKTPTADDHKKTAIFDSGKHPRSKAPSDFPQDVAPTVVDGPLGRPAMAENPAPSGATPTVLEKPARQAKPAGSSAAPTVMAKPAPQEKPAGSSAAPTVMAKPAPQVKPQAAAPIQVISKKDASAPIQVISKKERSAPIQAISMKTPDNQQKPPAPENPPTPILQRPKLRAVSEVTPVKQPQNLGNLAAPYDPKEARARRVREYVIWGCLAVILASAIALVVWFVAR